MLFGGAGDVDYLVGGAWGDTMEGNDGMDLVMGDHAKFEFTSSVSHQLQYAETIDPTCTGGADVIRLGRGNDMVRCYLY